MTKRKFSAANWLDEVEAIQGVDIYVAKVDGKDDTVWSGMRIWTRHSEDGMLAVTDDGGRRYHELMAEMKAAPHGVERVKGELVKRGRVIRFTRPAVS